MELKKIKIVTKPLIMKNIITFITLLVFYTSCSAQQTIVDISNRENWTTNTYLKDTNNHFNDVLGTWKWENGNNSFEIVFTKITNYSYDGINMSTDFIIGRYKYIENGNLIADILNNTNYTPLDFEATLFFNSPTEYGFIVHDVVSNKTKKGKFIISSSGLDTTATYNIQNTEGLKFNQTNTEFSLPTELTLIKQ